MQPDEPPPPLKQLQGHALFLDFDGTLVELAEAPDLIEVPESLPELLRKLDRFLAGRLALVSGRAVADVQAYLPIDGLVLAGSHGLELPMDGATPPGLPPGLEEEVRALAGSRPGLLLERKPASLALHYRAVPEAGEGVDRFLSALAERHGLLVQRGAMVAEIRPRGADKGEAVRRIMMEPPFAGARPLVVGDDLTDEHAFEAAAALGGSGILVGPLRETAARWRLPGVSAVTEWLTAAVEG